VLAACLLSIQPMEVSDQRPRQKILEGLGVCAGVPDVIAIRAGQICCPELKASRGRLSTVQHETIAALNAVGARVEVASSLDDALGHLERWGILRGHTQ
jgi:hypothetical protein